jgi:hypothetical protein
MTEPGHIRDEFDPFASRTQRRRARLDRRREKIVAEIQRNRRGEHKVPTWVLVAILLAIIGVWAVLVIVK